MVETLCNNCKEQVGKHRCGNCKAVYYCSQTCQKQHWPQHKPTCLNPVKFFAENKANLQFLDFEVIKKLGVGNFTEVFKVAHSKMPNNYFALKVCQIQRVTSMRRETDILLEKHSLNKIYQKYGGKTPDQMPTVHLLQTWKDYESLYFLTECLEQRLELWENCRSFGILNEALAIWIFKQICISVSKLHAIGIVHRDLKPENMFLKDFEFEKGVTLIDLGSSEDLEQPDLRKVHIDDNPRRNTHVNYVGTSQYMSPECARNQKVGFAADIWSLGCILYQLISGLVPFRGDSDYLVFRRSTEAKYNLELPCFKDDTAKDLIRLCLQIDQEARPTIEQVLEHPVFESVQSKPEIQQWERELKEQLQDLIKRKNVYEFDGKQKFIQHFDQNIRQIIPTQELADYYFSLSLFLLFDEDPEAEALETEKDALKTMMENAKQRQKLEREADQEVVTSDSDSDHQNQSNQQDQQNIQNQQSSADQINEESKN